MNALEQLTDEGHHALLRYRQRQDQMDLDSAVQTFQHVQEICPIDDVNRSAVLFNMANAKFIDCQANNRYLDLDVPIGLYRDALRFRSTNHPDHCTTVLELGLALLARFQRRGFEFDREEAKDLLAGVIEVSAEESYAHRAGLFALQMAKVSVSVEAGDGGSSLVEQANGDDVIQRARDLLQNMSYWNPDRTTLIFGLGMLLSERFARNGVLGDIIWMLESAVDLWRGYSHPDMPSLLNNLGNLLLSRFERLGNLVDLERSMSMFEEAVCLSPDGHPDRPAFLNNLGNSFLSRFERLGDLADLNRSIPMREEAINFTPDGRPGKPTMLIDLGQTFNIRFTHSRDSSDLSAAAFNFSIASLNRASICPASARFRASCAWISCA